MIRFILRRFAYMILLLVAVSILGFVVIQLPPGDWLSTYIVQVQMTGGIVEQQQVDSLRRMYGLDQPLYAQYVKWVVGMLRGDFGYSFFWKRPVAELIGERMGYTILISGLTLLFSYGAAIYIGVYSATHQYRAGDYAATVFGFIGLSTPPFLLALVLVYFIFRAFGMNVVGLFSPQFVEAPWSLARVWDMLLHLPVPVIVVGAAGIAGLQRIMRATLLDELKFWSWAPRRACFGVTGATVCF